MFNGNWNFPDSNFHTNTNKYRHNRPAVLFWGLFTPETLGEKQYYLIENALAWLVNWMFIVKLRIMIWLGWEGSLDPDALCSSALTRSLVGTPNFILIHLTPKFHPKQYWQRDRTKHREYYTSIKCSQNKLL